MNLKCALLILTMFQVLGCDVNGKYLNSKTLHVGFNGLNVASKIQIYEDNKTIENSWLKNALTPNELKQLVGKIDFEKQFILVLSFGKRPNANGKIIINSIRYTTHPQSMFSSIDTNLNIGIADRKECNISIDIESFPFIIELVERPKNKLKLDVGSYGAFNFGDGCATPIAGKPTPE